MQKWEYKMVSGIITEKQLNEIGLQGWELVVVTREGFAIAFFFKRPITN